MCIGGVRTIYNKENYLAYLKDKSVLLILLILTILYTLIWSILGIEKILSLNAYVWDLGINSQRGWDIIRYNQGFIEYLHTFFDSSIVFLLAPLTSSGNFFAMIVFQAGSIAIIGPAFYSISRIKGLTRIHSLLVSSVFYLYFPTDGIMWFDFHYQIFFFPLFVFAYLSYISKYYRASVLLFLLSGMVRYPYSIFPLMFSVFEIISLGINKNLNSKDTRKQLWTLLCILLLNFLMILGGFILFGRTLTLPHLETSLYTVTNITILNRVVIVLIFLSPLIFLPLLSPRWFIFTIPGFYLIFSSSYFWYSYPSIFQGQYVTGFVPFLILGFIEGMIKLENLSSKQRVIFFKGHFWKSTLTKGNQLRIVLVILILFNIVFAPFGPLNSYSTDNFNFHNNTDFNLQKYNELNTMIKMIPANATYVAYQNNIPEMLPRSLPSGGMILIGGYLGAFDSFNLTNAIENNWPVIFNNKTYEIPINYAIADASNPNFYLQGNSTYKLIQTMVESGKYSILGEGYGLILLKRGYIKTMQTFVPINYTSNELNVLNIDGSKQYLDIFSNLSKNNTIISINLKYLMPGNYKIMIKGITNNFIQKNLTKIVVISTFDHRIITRFNSSINYNKESNILVFNPHFEISNVFGPTTMYIDIEGNLQSSTNLTFNLIQAL